MKTATISLPALFMTCLFLTGALSAWPQPEGWRYREFMTGTGGSPKARLLNQDTGRQLTVAAGEDLEGFRVLTINRDRLVLRKEQQVASIVHDSLIPDLGLDNRVEHLHFHRVALHDILADLCERSRLELVTELSLAGKMSVEFANATIREVLDWLCEQNDLSYRTDNRRLWVFHSKGGGSVKE